MWLHLICFLKKMWPVFSVKILLLHSQSMLLCVCLVTNNRWGQNVVTTKRLHTRRSRVCHWCSHHILMFSVTLYCTDPWQHGIHLFHMIKKRDVVNDEVIYAFVLQYIIKENQTKCVGDRATKRKKLSCNPANTEGEMIILKLWQFIWLSATSSF